MGRCASSGGCAAQGRERQGSASAEPLIYGCIFPLLAPAALLPFQPRGIQHGYARPGQNRIAREIRAFAAEAQLLLQHTIAREAIAGLVIFHTPGAFAAEKRRARAAIEAAFADQPVIHVAFPPDTHMPAMVKVLFAEGFDEKILLDVDDCR